MLRAVFLIIAVITNASFTYTAEPANRMHRIGLLAQRPDGRAEFKDALRNFGYIEGQNIIVEDRFAHGKPELFSEFVLDLMRRNVSLIVAVGPTAIGVTLKSTKTLPIVMAGSGNPVARGFVKSLSVPGGNITGLSSFLEGEEAKRLELLKETFPQISRVTVINSDRKVRGENYKSVEKQFGFNVQVLHITATEQFESVIRDVVRTRPHALVTVRDTFNYAYEDELAEFAIKNRLPSMHAARDFVQRGGLMSYGINYVGLWRRAATFVDKILKGANPATLPVEPPEFEFVINLVTARKIGALIPPGILLEANEILR